MALERKGKQTVRGDIWRKVVGLNLDKFGAWLSLQRVRLDRLWKDLEVAMSRQRQQNSEAFGVVGSLDATRDAAGFTQEKRNRLLGRRNDETNLPERNVIVANYRQRLRRDEKRER